jgi:hypothetical protein
MRRGNHLVFRFALLRVNLFQSLFVRLQFRSCRFQRRLFLGHLTLEPQHLGI